MEAAVDDAETLVQPTPVAGVMVAGVVVPVDATDLTTAVKLTAEGDGVERAVEAGDTLDTMRTGDGGALPGALLVGVASSAREDFGAWLGDPEGRESTLMGCVVAAAVTRGDVLPGRRDRWQVALLVVPVPGFPPPAPPRALLMMRVRRCWEESAEAEEPR